LTTTGGVDARSRGDGEKLRKLFEMLFAFRIARRYSLRWIFDLWAHDVWRNMDGAYDNYYIPTMHILSLRLFLLFNIFIWNMIIWNEQVDAHDFQNFRRTCVRLFVLYNYILCSYVGFPVWLDKRIFSCLYLGTFGINVRISNQRAYHPNPSCDRE
jgi:hypothetical protein